MSRITIDGVEYDNPECKCKGPGHICYLRPVPTEIKFDSPEAQAEWLRKLKGSFGRTTDVSGASSNE